MKKLLIFLLLTFSYLLLTYNYSSAQWIKQNSGTTANLKSVYFANDTTGWAVGEQGTIVMTTDGGTTWTAQNSGTAVTLWSTSNGWAVGDSAKMLQYTGTQWMTYTMATNIPYPYTWFSSHAINNSVFIAGGDTIDYSCFFAYNIGASWYGNSTPLVGFSAHAIYAYDMNHIFMLLNSYGSYNIFRSANGGSKWANQPYYNSNFSKLTSICVLDKNHGWCVGDSGNILSYSHDTAWVNTPNGFDKTYYSVYFSDTNHGWVVGDEGRIDKFVWGQWKTDVSNVNYRLNSVYFPDANNGWIVGDNGTILHITNAAAVKEKNSLSFSIQNYPNPCNKKQSFIKYNIDERCQVTLKIYDITGKEISTIVNEQKEKGNYTASFSTENLKGGVYLYRIKAGNYVYTDKMILIK